MQSLRQPIQRDKPGAAAEDAIEPGAQCQTAVLAGVDPVHLEFGVELPDKRADALLSRTMQIRESIKLMHQPFRMDPAQRVLSDVELAGIVAQHHSVAQKTVCMDAAPLSPLGGDRPRVLDCSQ